MNSDPRQSADRKIGFAPRPELAKGAQRSRHPLRRALHAGLIAIALWAVAGAPILCFAAENGNNPPPDNDTHAAAAIIHNSSVHAPPIQMKVDRVVIPVTVTDPDGYIRTDLVEDNFEVFDNKVKQTILTFSAEDAPVAVCIVFDTSRSMSDKIQKSREAALQFFKSSNPEDEFMLVAFNSRPYLVSEFTADYEKLLDEVLFMKSDGRTSLLDGIYIGLARLKQVSADRKVLLVISDGGDNHSRYTLWDIKKIIKESNVQIYTIGIFEPIEYRNRTVEEASGPGLLSELANISGGRAFSADDPNDLPDIAEEISHTIRNQYVIAYKPSNLVRDGRWRHIRIKVHPSSGRPLLQIYTRTGYYAPTQ